MMLRLTSRRDCGYAKFSDLAVTAMEYGHLVGHHIARYLEGKEYLGLFGDSPKGKELEHIVIQHSAIGSAAAFIPVPGADIAAIVANIWAMYARINDAVGVSFSENFLKSVASGIISNVISIVPAAALAIGAETIMKFFPGLGTGGGIALGLAANAALMYAAGSIYIMSLGVLVNSGEPLTEENIKHVVEKTSQDKDFVKRVYERGKSVAKKSDEETSSH